MQDIQGKKGMKIRIPQEYFALPRPLNKIMGCHTQIKIKFLVKRNCDLMSISCHLNFSPVFFPASKVTFIPLPPPTER